MKAGKASLRLHGLRPYPTAAVGQRVGLVAVPGAPGAACSGRGGVPGGAGGRVERVEVPWWPVAALASESGWWRCLERPARPAAGMAAFLVELAAVSSAWRCPGGPWRRWPVRGAGGRAWSSVVASRFFDVAFRLRAWWRSWPSWWRWPVPAGVGCAWWLWRQVPNG